MSEYTTVSIKPTTKQKLQSVCLKSQNYDELILELLKLKEAAKN